MRSGIIFLLYFDKYKESLYFLNIVVETRKKIHTPAWGVSPIETDYSA